MPTIQDINPEESFYSDDSFSDHTDEELRVDSRVSQATPQSVRPKSATRGNPRKAGPKKPPSPYQQRPSSAKQGAKIAALSSSSPQKSSRELWLQSLRLGTGNLTGSGRSSNYAGKAGSPGLGLSSCSDYLKETVLGMTSKRQHGNSLDEPLNRNTKGVPNYKPKEDMYDDILELKKQNNVLKADNERVKARNRRLEDEHLKKERTIEQLLDPTKGDVRMTLTSKQPDTAAKMNSLKQKVIKLEMVLKEREMELSNLKSDLKTTKIDEMRVGMEAFYQEVQRLRYLQSQGVKENGRSPSRPTTAEKDSNSTAKLKALNATILRLTESNQRLQSENKLLKQDLERALDEAMSDLGDTPRAKKRRQRKRDFEDMNRKELLTAVLDLEDKVAKLEGKTSAHPSRRRDVPEKIELSGSLADRLDQLDKRETELLEEKTRLERDCKRLKDDKSKLRQRVDELEEEVSALKNELSDSKPKNRRRSLQRHSSAESLCRPGSDRSQKRRQQQQQQQREEDWIRERDRKVEEFRKNCSARNIQRNWKAHQKRLADDEEMDSAAVMIQSAVRGHVSRKEHLRKQESNQRRRSRSVYSDDDDDVDDSEMEDAALTIQSAVRGHMSRKDYMKKSGGDGGGDDSGMEDAALTIQSAVRGHMSRKDYMKKRCRLITTGDEDDFVSERENRVSSRSRSGSRHSKYNGNLSSRAASEIEEEIVDSDDDSIVIGGSTANLRMSSNQSSRPTSARKERESPVLKLGSHSTPRISRTNSRASTPRFAPDIVVDDDDDDGDSDYNDFVIGVNK